MLASDIGVDLGTDSVLVYIRGTGVVLREPSVVAYDRDTNEVKNIGEEARQMIGRTPGNIVAVHPLRQGVISDYTITEKMLKYFIHKAVGRKTFWKPRITVCVPSGEFPLLRAFHNERLPGQHNRGEDTPPECRAAFSRKCGVGGRCKKALADP